MRTEYRADIDGLRAVAVGAVVLFHAFPSLLPGGFVGVDVFFVISGFLITGIVAGELDRGTFTYRGFYGRRVRRIAPALTVVIAATVVAGWFVLRADEYADLGRHVAASALFLSNFLLWSQVGYFEPAAHGKPLLHLWSLAVEEQFYLVWPPLLAAIWRWGHRYRFAILGALTAASLAYCVLLTDQDQTAGFFSPLTRLWQLAAGGLLALGWQGAAGHRKPPRLAIKECARSTSRGTPDGGATFETSAPQAPQDDDRGRGQRPYAPTLSHAASLVGLGLIAVAFLRFDAFSVYPGWRALLPTAGAVLLIGAGPKAVVNRFLLSNRIAVGLGLISYPLYLWHWPPIAFGAVFADMAGEGYLPRSVRLALVLGSVALAWATYRFIETPIRTRRLSMRTVGPLVAAVPAFLLIGFGLQAAGGFPSRTADSDPRARFLGHYARLRHTVLAQAYRSECDFYDWDTRGRRPAIDPSCTAAGAKGTWMLWGDSHAQALSAGLRAIVPDGVALAQIATSGCAPSLGATLQAPAGACDPSNAEARRALATLKPELLILAQAGAHDGTDWEGIARFAREAGVREVVLIGPTPQWLPGLPQRVVAGYWDKRSNDLAIPANPAVIELDRRLAARFAKDDALTYISLIDKLCRAGVCRAGVPGQEPFELLILDYGHLTPDGSRYVGREVLAGRLRDLTAKR